MTTFRICDFILAVALVLIGQVWTALGFMLLTAMEDWLENGEPPHYKLRVR